MVLLVAVLASAAGATISSGEPSPSKMIVASRATASIVVHHELLPDRGGPHYLEGAQWYIRIRNAEGVLFDGPGSEEKRTSVRRRVPPGTYLLRSYLRPCSANCQEENLMGPTDSCSLSVTIPSGRLAEVEVQTLPGRPCQIRLVR